MPDHLGGDMRKVKHEPDEEEKEFKSEYSCSQAIVQCTVEMSIWYVL